VLSFKGCSQRLHPLGDRLAASLDETIRVEEQRGPGPDRDSDFSLRCFGDTERRRPAFYEIVRWSVRFDQQRRRMARVRECESLSVRIEYAIDERCHLCGIEFVR